MKPASLATAVIFLIFLFVNCSRVGDGDYGGLKVAGPDFLVDLMELAAKQFEAENQVQVNIIYIHPDSVLGKVLADSGVDLFFSPYPRKLDRRHVRSKLQDKQFVCPFRLSLVMAGKAGSKLLEALGESGRLQNLQDDNFRRVAINDPRQTYEGFLAAKVLDRFRLRTKLKSKLIIARDRQHLLNYLETGEADVAIMLEISLNEGEGLVAYMRLDEKLEQYVTVCGAVTVGSRRANEARAFLDLFESRLCDIYKLKGVYQL